MEKQARKAVGVDSELKAANLNRLKRIEGQVRGLQKMVEDDRYCADILTQISSVQEALRAVGRELMRNHLKHCATKAIKTGPAGGGDVRRAHRADLQAQPVGGNITLTPWFPAPRLAAGRRWVLRDRGASRIQRPAPPLRRRRGRRGA